MNKGINIPNIFLWAAHFEDGTSIWQDETDVSRTYVPETDSDPPKNQFWDVLQKQKESDLRTFTFYHSTVNAETGEVAVVSQWAVDLKDGHFEHNQIPFWLHRTEHDEHYKDFRLIQFRSVSQYKNQATGEEYGQVDSYILGWQTNDKAGKNVQRIVKIVA
jgi:hypothetical protein